MDATTAPMEFRWEWEIPLERPQLWRFVADSDRINRLAGLFTVDYEYRPLDSGGSEVRGCTRAFGITIRWVERPCEWVEPRYFEIRRDYHHGPMRGFDSRVELTELSEGRTLLRQIIRVEPSSALSRPLIWATVGQMTKRALSRAYQRAPEWARQQTAPSPGTAAAANTLGTSERQRHRAAAKLERALRQGPTFEFEPKLMGHLCGTDAADVRRLAPYQLADRWQADRRDVLRCFLHATRSGAFDMDYNLVCPSCRRAKATFQKLADVPEEGHCPTCNIAFAVDFDRAVEVRFSPDPLGLPVTDEQYCHSGPRNTPHRLANLPLPAKAPGELRFVARPGKHQLVSPQCPGAVFSEFVADGTAPPGAAIRLTSEGIVGLPEVLRVGAVQLDVQNELPTPAELTLVRADWADDAVTAADVTALSEFRDLFGSEILAPGAEFAIRNMVFLFSDLVGSTAMYQRIGDAPAFALVRDHFELLRDIYQRHGGALVKTIGDAVMAVFRSADDGLRAALEMHRRIGELAAPSGDGLALRIGLHCGPCIAMEANGEVDYFGTTVNLAARVQGCAGAAEVALSPEMAARPEVRQRIERLELRSRKCEFDLKGLSGRYSIELLRATTE